MRCLLLLALLAGPLTGAAAAQPAADVHLPPIEIGTAFSYDVHRDGTADLPGGPGAVILVDGNVNGHLAVAGQMSDSPRMRAAMAGARVSTGYFNEGPGGPGRFFLQVLAGAQEGPAGGRAVVLLGAGADVLVARRGLSLHWGLDYLFTSGAHTAFAGPRVSVGLVAGPRAK